MMIRGADPMELHPYYVPPGVHVATPRQLALYLNEHPPEDLGPLRLYLRSLARRQQNYNLPGVAITRGIVRLPDHLILRYALPLLPELTLL